MKYKISNTRLAQVLYQGILRPARRDQGRFSNVPEERRLRFGLQPLSTISSPGPKGETSFSWLSARLKACPELGEVCPDTKRQFLLAVFLTFAVVLLALSAASGQVASHTPTTFSQPAHPGTPVAAKPVTGKPVARVNGAVLTDRDLVREEYSIFPYARQHNGQIPQEMEPQIRNGAMQMIIFEELVYQEAQRRHITISAERLNKAETDFRKQFSSPAEYNNFLKTEFNGSEQALREKIRRSLMIEAVLKTDVDDKSTVSVADAKAYYDKNPALYQYPESFAIQTISIVPPENATPAQMKEARKKAEDALKQAKATKNYEEFGVLAEKISEDDYRVMMGDHRAVARDKLAPQLVQALLAMQPGQITDVIQVDTIYTIVRLNKHIPAGKFTFQTVQAQLVKQLQAKKTNDVRAAFDKKLKQNAKIEVL
jgi:parvulin-like peptidyl-prolyl isomerase